MASLEAAAGARLIPTAMTFTLERQNVLEMTGAIKSDYPFIFLRASLLSSLAGVPALALMAFSGWSPETSLALIVLAILLGAVL